ncbi:hypothetical protein [Chryseobacterium sp. X308]|uniref:hypothetical protein n=1 Tax=Chryseobacterium sp. X308 TaxID=2884873 RepID=UPI001D143910|nr:hypothetical protein [Chryseobacterium sp. X308]
METGSGVSLRVGGFEGNEMRVASFGVLESDDLRDLGFGIRVSWCGIRDFKFGF